MKHVIAIAVLSAFGLAAFCAVAQPPAPQSPPNEGKMRGDDRELGQLIEAVMAARLAKQLGLNDEQTVVMVRRFAEYKEELSRLRAKRQELVRQLHEQIKKGEAEPAMQHTLDQILEQDHAMAVFKIDAYRRAGENLSVEQRAKLYVFLNDFEDDMRKLIQRVRAKRFEGGPMMDPARPLGPDNAPRRHGPGQRGPERAGQEPVPGQPPIPGPQPGMAPPPPGMAAPQPPAP